MRCLSLLVVLLVVAVVTVQAGVKKPKPKGPVCKYFGQICAKGKNCIPSYYRGVLKCRGRSYLGGCKKLCRYGGSWCPKNKVCKKTSKGRECVFRKGFKVYSCKKFGQKCANGRRCFPCYLRRGLCCRRAALLGKKKYCGEKYRAYGKYCGKKYSKKGCYLYGKTCLDGKSCTKQKNGKFTCQFRKKLPSCRYFGQICGLKNGRNCLPCYNRKGLLCCRRRKLLATCAYHCRYGGKYCPDKKTCRQSIKKGVLRRRCVYVPVCKRVGQSCGRYNKRVCKKCSKNKLCCRRRGVTKKECLARCKGPYKYCSKKGCSKKFIGYCCKTKPYITKKVCEKSCRGAYRYCSLKYCNKGHRGYCCRKRVICKGKFCKKG